MGWQYTPYVLPLLIAAAISMALAVYVRQRRTALGATAFTILVLAVAEWSVGYALELGSANLAAKLFWAQVEYLGIVAIPLAWLAFALQYTQRDQWLTAHRRNSLLLALVPFLTLVLVWSNAAHGLIWSSISVDISGPFSVLKVTHGPWFWVHSAFSYLLLLLGTIQLIAMLLRSPHLYRQQAGALIIGVLAPWVGNGLYLSGLSPVTHLDVTPFAFTLSGLIFAWGLFRFRLLDIVPVARRTVVDGMSDGVIVLDLQNRIVDLNPTARQIIGPAANTALGRPAAQVFADHADLVDHFRDVSDVQAEISLGQLGQSRHYDLHISTLADSRHHPLGRVVILHDINTLKQTEEALRNQKQLFENLVAVARATAEQPSLKATLQNALDIAATLTAAELGSLFLLNESGSVHHYLPTLGKMTLGQEPGYISRVMDMGLGGWVVRHRQAALIYDVTEDDRWLPSASGTPITVRSALAVPIMTGSATLGVLTLTHSVAGHFNVEHLHLMQAAVDQMALAIRNAQIFEAQRRLADRQITLYEILRAVAGQTDPDRVIRVAAATIAQTAGWTNVIIALADEEQTQWTVRAASGTLAHLTGQSYSIRTGIIGLVFKTGQSQQSPQLNQHQADPLLEPATGSLLAVPLRRQGQRMLGVLGLTGTQPGAVDPDDVLLAESVAEAVALALDNARLHAETQQRLKEQTIFREASTVISSSLDLPTVLHHLAEQLGQAVDVTSAYICSYNPETTTATVLAEYVGPQAGASEQGSNLNTVYNLAQDFADMLPFLRAGQPRLNHSDNPYLGAAQRGHMQRFGAQTSVMFPLQIRGETIAYAELRDSRRRREFTSAEMVLCLGLAQQAAIAIENARLYDEIHQQAIGLSALYTVTRMVSQSLVREDLLAQALSATLLSLGFEAGVISLADSADGRLHLATTHGLPSALVAYFKQNELKGTLGEYAHTRQEVVAINDLRQEAPVDISELVVMGFRAYVGIPLPHQKQSLGVMSLFTRQPQPAAAADLALLATIGQQVAVAVANARLYKNVVDERSRLQALIEASRDGVLLVGMDQQVLVSNVPALELLGLAGKPEALVNRPITEILLALRGHARPVVKVALAEMKRIRQGDEPASEGEYELSSQTVHWSNLPVLAGSAPLGRLIVLRDMTEERQLDKLRDDLTHTMVHDLRNPLAAISSSLQLINMVGDNLLPDQQWMLEIARNRTKDMLELVNDILEVSQLESRRMPLKYAPLPLAELINETLQAQSPLATAKELHLESEMPQVLPPVNADRRLIERILQNLVGNAIKFTPAGGRVKITVRPAAESLQPANGCDHYLDIATSDTGPGISAELQSRLFQKFVTGRQEGSGSGLGLAFCKLAVEAHGGHIWVESKAGEGTVFHFTLPVRSMAERAEVET